MWLNPVTPSPPTTASTASRGSVVNSWLSMADSASGRSGTSTSARKPSLPRFTPSTGYRCRSARRMARSIVPSPPRLTSRSARWRSSSALTASAVQAILRISLSMPRTSICRRAAPSQMAATAPLQSRSGCSTMPTTCISAWPCGVMGHGHKVLKHPAPRALASGTKSAQAGPDFADQDLGLFQGGEVPALAGLAVVDQIAVGVFDPASRQARDVLREDRHRDRQRQLRAGERARLVLPVDAGGRRCAVGEPVQGYRVEHVVPAEGVLGEPVVVGLGLELVVDPGGLTSGRVRQGESGRLRLRALKVVRPAEFAGVEGEGLHGVALFGRQGVGYLGGKGVLGVQVNSEKPLGLHGPQGGGDDGTPVAALRGPSRVAETLHQLRPRACDARYSPPGLRGLLGESEPGERRDDDVE